MDEVKKLRDKLDQTFIDNWIESIPERLRECIKFQGEKINRYLILIFLKFFG